MSLTRPFGYPWPQSGQTRSSPHGALAGAPVIANRPSWTRVGKELRAAIRRSADRADTRTAVDDTNHSRAGGAHGQLEKIAHDSRAGTSSINKISVSEQDLMSPVTLL